MAEGRAESRTQDSGYGSDGEEYGSPDQKIGICGSSPEDQNKPTVAVKAILMIVNDKNQTHHDFFRALDKQKGHLNPVHIHMDNLNLIQAIVEKSRLSLLPTIVQVGWWTMLKDKTAGPGSIHKGKTARQIAESKNSRKPLDEFVVNQEWDASLTSLMRACRSRDISRALLLVESQGTDLFYTDYHGNNCLYWAVISGDVGFFEKLISLGLNEKTRNQKGETLLHVAAQTGRHQFIGKLVTKYHVDPTLLDNTKKSALDRASEAGDIEVLTEFVKCGVQPEGNALALSAHSGRLCFLTFVLDTLKMDIEAADIYGRTALYRACESGSVEIVRCLLKRGASVMSCSTMGRNILHVVAEAGNVIIMDLIIEALRKTGGLKEALDKKDRYNGVDLCFLIRGRDKGRDAFHYVEVERFKVSIFLKRTKAGNVDIAQFGTVLKSGWGVNSSQEVVDEIEDIFKNRRLDATAVLDMTPLHVALVKGNTVIARKLVELGADVNVQDKFGLTPVLLAACRGDLESVNNLEKAGADTKVACTAGHNIKDLAEINEHDHIANFAASDEAYAVAKKFVKGPLDALLRGLDQIQRKGGVTRNQREKQLQAEIIHLGAAVDKALLEIGSSPVQQASDDQDNSEQIPGEAVRSSMENHVVTPAGQPLESNTRNDYRRNDTQTHSMPVMSHMQGGYGNQMPYECHQRPVPNTVRLASMQSRSPDDGLPLTGMYSMPTLSDSTRRYDHQMPFESQQRQITDTARLLSMQRGCLDSHNFHTRDHHSNYWMSD